MKIRQFICIMVAFSLLLLNCVEEARAGKRRILDDGGNVITELEIRGNMKSRYRVGCVIGGGLLSIAPAALGGAAIAAGSCGGWFYNGHFDRCSKDTAEVVFLASTVALETVAITASYYIGKHFDRRGAINRIKARRRHQERHGPGARKMTVVVLLPIVQGTF